MTFHYLPGSLPLLTSLRTLPPHSARRGRPGCFNNLGPGATPSNELSPPPVMLAKQAAQTTRSEASLPTWWRRPSRPPQPCIRWIRERSENHDAVVRIGGRGSSEAGPFCTSAWKPWGRYGSLPPRTVVGRFAAGSKLSVRDPMFRPSSDAGRRRAESRLWSRSATRLSAVYAPARRSWFCVQLASRLLCALDTTALVRCGSGT
jgi:hypothetical protein